MAEYQRLLVEKTPVFVVQYLGYANNLQGNETAAIIRLAEVYLMQAEAWNEYLEQPDSRVYDPLDKVRERAGVLPVREAWGSYSNNPVKVTTKVGMRDIIHQEYGIEFAFEDIATGIFAAG